MAAGWGRRPRAAPPSGPLAVQEGVTVAGAVVAGLPVAVLDAACCTVTLSGGSAQRDEHVNRSARRHLGTGASSSGGGGGGDRGALQRSEVIWEQRRGGRRGGALHRREVCYSARPTSLKVPESPDAAKAAACALKSC